MDTKKALENVQAARHALASLYCVAPDHELCVLSTPIPEKFIELSNFLHGAEEWLIEDEPTDWDNRVIGFTNEGPIRRRHIERSGT